MMKYLFLFLIPGVLANYASFNVEEVRKINLESLLGFIKPEGDGVSEACLVAGRYFEEKLVARAPWALTMLDSNGLLPGAGMASLNILHYPGNMHQCLSASPDLFLPSHMLITFKQSPGLQNLHRIGRCLPNLCSEEDVVAGVNNYLASMGVANASATVLNSHIKGETIDWSSGDVAMMAVVGVILAVVVACTVLDVLAIDFDIKAVQRAQAHIWQGFSIYTNLGKIMRVQEAAGGDGNLSCLNGLRAISISWVVIGHTLFEYSNLGILSGTGMFHLSLGLFTEEGGVFDSPALSAGWNALFSVDTFFLISGTLMSYNLLKTLEKKGNSPQVWAVIYVHRYIRLSSVYAILIGLHATLLKVLADGPYSFLIERQVEKCQQGWYYNLLYVNNLVDPEYKCMAWTWYLAIDMQFFVVTPIFIYLFWKIKRPLVIGGISFIVLLAFSLTPFFLTFYDDTQFFQGDINTFYTKPWTRFQPYYIGLLLGLYLHNNREEPTLKLSWILNIVLWCVSFTLGLAALYGISNYNPVHNPALMTQNADFTWERSFYNGFSKLAWSLGLTYLILACVKGRGGPINTFLSWSAWVPVARISYCIYLVQYTVIFYYNSQLSYPINYSSLEFAYLSVANFGFSCGVALVMVVLFEAPLAHLEKLLMAMVGADRWPKSSFAKTVTLEK